MLFWGNPLENDVIREFPNNWEIPFGLVKEEFMTSYNLLTTFSTLSFITQKIFCCRP
jgi:hypothetical protein